MESEFIDQMTSFTGIESLISNGQEVRWSQSLSGYNGEEIILDLQELTTGNPLRSLFII